MEHITTFVLILSFAFSLISAALCLVIRRQHSHQAMTWLAVAMAGLGLFLLEIIIWRYGHILRPVLPPTVFTKMLAFSKFWAVTGTLFMAVSMTKLARMLTGLPSTVYWRIVEVSLPLLTAFTGICFLRGVGGNFTVAVLQILLFGSVAGGFTMIVFMRPEKNNLGDDKFLKLIIVLAALCLPLIIVDATGVFDLLFFNDLPLAVFVSALSLILFFQARKLSSQPTYLSAGRLSDHFVQHFGISKREREVIALVLEGDANAIIAGKLFISIKTVENHMTSILRKTAVKNRIHLFRLIHSSSD